MWTLIQTLLKGAILKWLLKTLGSLGLWVPIAFILKMVGLPVLMVLAVLALKIVVPIVLIVWLVKWIMGWNGSKPDAGTPPPPTTGPVSDM